MLSQHPGPWDPALVGAFGCPEKALEDVVWADPPGQGCWNDIGGHTLEQLHLRTPFPGPLQGQARLSHISRLHGVTPPHPSGTARHPRGEEKWMGWGALGGAPHPALSCSAGHPQAGEHRGAGCRAAPCLAAAGPRSWAGVTAQTPSAIPAGRESSRAFHGKRRCQNGEVKAVQCFSGKGKAQSDGRRCLGNLRSGGMSSEHDWR